MNDKKLSEKEVDIINCLCDIDDQLPDGYEKVVVWQSFVEYGLIDLANKRTREALRRNGIVIIG